MMIILFAGAVIAGFLGSLTGLGGGVIIIPLMSLGLGIDIHYAIGTSLISVIATSSSAAMSNIRNGLLNIRLGMFLEIATTTGAIAGAAIAHYTPKFLIAIIFGLVLLFSSVNSLLPERNQERDNSEKAERQAGFIRLLKFQEIESSTGESEKYSLRNPVWGFILMVVAGILSGLLGIGSGALKVIAMDSVMNVPFKISAATSNFMIGVTAAASAGIYLNRGYIDPLLSMPVMLGVLAGSFTGARILSQSKTRKLKKVFAVLIFFLAIEMIYEGLSMKM